MLTAGRKCNGQTNRNYDAKLRCLQEKFMNLNDNKWSKWLPPFIFAVILIVLYKTLDSFSDIKESISGFLRTVSPFLIAILIVYFLYIPCEKLEKLYVKSKRSFIIKSARGLSILSVYSILILMVVFVVIFIIPILIKSLIEFAGSVPLYYNNIMDKFPNNDIINGIISNFDASSFSNLLDPMRLAQLGRSIMAFTSGIFSTVISLVVSLYILIDRDNIIAFFSKASNALFKENARNQLKKYMQLVNKVLFAFILGKSIDSLINAVVVTTILLVLQVKHALLLGIICGIANFIPYLGSLVAVIFVIVVTFITGGMTQAIPTLISLLIFQQLDGNVIEPKIMGKTLKINPLLIIFSVIASGAYFGIVGMFLAVPVVTILKQIFMEYIDSRDVKNNSPAIVNEGDPGNS